MAARNSVSSVRMQRAFPQVVQEEEEEEVAFNYWKSLFQLEYKDPFVLDLHSSW